MNTEQLADTNMELRTKVEMVHKRLFAVANKLCGPASLESEIKGSDVRAAEPLGFFPYQTHFNHETLALFNRTLEQIARLERLIEEAPAVALSR